MKEMGRLNFVISDGLDDEMRKYIEENNLTITTFLHLAISRYLESQEQTKKIKKMFTELLSDELKKEKEKRKE